MKRITPQEAHELMTREGYVYLDVRAVQEFEGGHPEGAYNVPLSHLTPHGMQPNERFVDEVSTAFARNTKLVVGCQSGVRSLRAAELLVAAGFKQVVEQRAGLEGVKDAFGRVREPGWRTVGLPLSTTPQPGRAYAELCGAAATHD
jgi:rhodanese-related sulfurtransferase